ncbi:MAG: 2-C-methyl-D-erythritol 4-phosphate cytidylyltransferase [Lachnospiraceae bacterium]
MEYTTAIILAAGAGKRMHADCRKQYLLLEEKPLLYYAIKACEQADCIRSIVLVVGTGEESYVREQIVEAYDCHKVEAIVAGGAERYHSVAAGLEALAKMREQGYLCDYVLIHDGARPFLTEDILTRGLAGAREYGACVIGMPVKDTIKIADSEGYIATTPNRNQVWMIQTPQIFSYTLVKHAYEQLLCHEEELLQQGIHITDDAMVVETYTDTQIRLIKGSYQNIKITTPEDLQIAEVFLRAERKEKFTNVVDTKK